MLEIVITQVNSVDVVHYIGYRTCWILVGDLMIMISQFHCKYTRNMCICWIKLHTEYTDAHAILVIYLCCVLIVHVILNSA